MFAGAVGIMCWASVRLTATLERIGASQRFSEGLLGIVTALGADAPEICTAFAALSFKQHDIGLGVVLGSNIFNLAGLLGLSALVAGRVQIGRQGLWFTGGTSLVVSAILVPLVLRWIPAWSSMVLLALVLAPYVALTAMHPAQIARLKLPSLWKKFLEAAVGHVHRDSSRRKKNRRAAWYDPMWVVIAVGLIVGCSIGAVRSAVSLGARWGVSQAVIGTLILAALTSIPNVIAAVQLARDGRGAAVVSESLNSNTLNVIAGIALPALLIGFTAPSPQIVFAALWLIGMKVVALIAASRRHGLLRGGGALLVALYAVFVVTVILWK